MSKGSIKNPSIAIRPGAKLHEYIRSLTDQDLELTENILKLHVALGGERNGRKTTTAEIPIAALTKRDEELLTTLTSDEKLSETVQQCLQQISMDFDSDADADEDDVETIGGDTATKNVSKAEAKRQRAKARESELARITLDLNDLKWLNVMLTKRRDSGDSTDYLHELLEGSRLILPKNELIERNPELEARCARLRREQENQTYQAMTKNVDNNRRMAPDDTIGSQSKLFVLHAVVLRLRFFFFFFQSNKSIVSSSVWCNLSFQ